MSAILSRLATVATVAALAAAGCGGLPADGEPATYRVVRVADGDTITIERDGKKVSVRMVGVDTPETVHPDKTRNNPRTRSGCHGKQASDYTKALQGRRVRLEHDRQATDKYGRELAYVYDGRRLVNLDLLAQGLARENGYGHRYQHETRFEAAQAEAKAARRGLWGRCPA